VDRLPAQRWVKYLFRYVERRVAAYLVITIIAIILGAYFGHPRHF
jgi:hypothetical protein